MQAPCSTKYRSCNVVVGNILNFMNKKEKFHSHCWLGNLVIDGKGETHVTRVVKDWTCESHRTRQLQG